MVEIEETKDKKTRARNEDTQPSDKVRNQQHNETKNSPKEGKWDSKTLIVNTPNDHCNSEENDKEKNDKKGNKSKSEEFSEDSTSKEETRKRRNNKEESSKPTQRKKKTKKIEWLQNMKNNINTYVKDIHCIIDVKKHPIKNLYTIKEKINVTTMKIWYTEQAIQQMQSNVSQEKIIQMIGNRNPLTVGAPGEKMSISMESYIQ